MKSGTSWLASRSSGSSCAAFLPSLFVHSVIELPEQPARPAYNANGTTRQRLPSRARNFWAPVLSTQARLPYAKSLERRNFAEPVIHILGHHPRRHASTRGRADANA
eukprot:6211853-Pleurochrysis_carterae.AAC.1